MLQPIPVQPLKYNNITIACGLEEDTPSLPIDVTVVEEDTWQVLAADNAAQESDEHPIRLMTSLIDQKPATPGEIIIHGTQWRSIIVDLDRYPVCETSWIVQTVQQLALQIEKHRISGISMPILGLRFDCIKTETFLEALENHLLSNPDLETLDNIWLRVPDDLLPEVTEILTKFTCGNNA